MGYGGFGVGLCGVLYGEFVVSQCDGIGM